MLPSSPHVKEVYSGAGGVFETVKPGTLLLDCSTIDPNVAYPIDRLRELADEGVIGEVAPRHFSFAGNQPDTVAEVRLDSGPACAAELVADGVDVVLLTPV